MKTNLLKQVPLLSDLPQEELHRLVASLGVVDFDPGVVLFRESEPGDSQNSLPP